MDSYIVYQEADKLLSKYPMLKALLINMQIELERIYYDEPTQALTEEEVLYALNFARELTDMPRSGSMPGDKMTNVIITKDRIMRVEYPGELINAIKIIGEVVKKTSWAMSSLSPGERKIIEARYFDRMDWKGVEEAIGLAPDRLRMIRKEAINKMLPLLRITPEQYEFCMGRLK